MSVGWSDGDPRQRQDGIGWVCRAIFPDERLRLHVGDAPLPEATVRYAVIPSVANARFLLPLASPRVTAASLLAYNALRPPKVRAGRAAVGFVARLGLLRLLRSPVLSVCCPAEVDQRELFLVEHLSELIGHGPLHGAIGIRPPDPHHKPTMQLFDEDGRARGYAKIGWNDATRAMVRAEATALTELPRAPQLGGARFGIPRPRGANATAAPGIEHTAPLAPGNAYPQAPRLALTTRWRDQEVAVIEPMPGGVRRIRRPAEPRLDAMLAVARRGGAPAEPQPLRGSAFLARWRGRAAGQPVLTAIDGLAARDGDVPLEFGDWHGDWVPWNLAEHRGTLIAWDWENRASDVPVGFDLAHQAFQMALSTHRQPAPVAAEAARAALRRYGPGLGLGAAQQAFVADAYLVELWLRACELHAGGGGWNAKLHPALLDVLADRLADTASTGS